jgi:hypothetical protein
MKKTLLLIITVLFVSSLALHSVHAQPAGGGNNGIPAGGGNNGMSNKLPTLTNPLKVNSVQELLFLIVDVLIFIGVILAVLMFVFIGFKFVMAQGNSDAIAEARRWFFWAVVGTAVLVSSKVIVGIIKDTFVGAGIVDQRLFDEPRK